MALTDATGERLPPSCWSLGPVERWYGACRSQDGSDCRQRRRGGRPKAIDQRPGGEADGAEGAGGRQQSSGGSGRGDAVRPEDDHRGGRAETRAHRKQPDHRHPDQQRSRVQNGGVDADPLEDQPVAGDLGADGEHDETDDAAAALEVPHHREALPETLAPIAGDPRQPADHGEPESEAQQRHPPGHAQRSNEGERGQRREADLHDHDRQLGRDQDGGRRAIDRRGTAQRGDPHRQPELTVEGVAEIAEARRPVEPVAG